MKARYAHLLTGALRAGVWSRASRFHLVEATFAVALDQAVHPPPRHAVTTGGFRLTQTLMNNRQNDDTGFGHLPSSAMPL
jgi:hypothetical protein